MEKYNDIRSVVPKTLILKANRKGNREADLIDKTGFHSVHVIHKSPKNYTRKIKHRYSI